MKVQCHIDVHLRLIGAVRTKLKSLGASAITVQGTTVYYRVSEDSRERVQEYIAGYVAGGQFVLHMTEMCN
jgi:hypothetical protein